MGGPSSPNQGDRPTDARQRLIAHFAVSEKQHGQLWADLWDEGSFLPWDKGKPSPALEDLLQQRLENLGLLPVEEKTALVPGCGRGYDVYLLAQAGFHAYGLEISSTAADQARQWIQDHSHSRTPHYEIICGDFYKSDWVPPGAAFDFIYDYTFFCAMPSALRKNWAERMSELTRPGGYLVCLEFPLSKPAETGGPPWGVKAEVYDELLGGNFDKVERFMPERTHPIGEGTDHVSIWRRKQSD